MTNRIGHHGPYNNPELPDGIKPQDVQTLNKRLTEWLAWRTQGGPVPRWHPQAKTQPQSK